MSRRRISKRVLRRRRQFAAGVAALLIAIGITVWASSDPDPWTGDTSEAQAAAASQEAFFERVVGPAQAGDQAHGVPAPVAIAQAILESNWAQSALTTKANALFGIKCGDSPYVAGCVDYPTTECDADGCYRTTASFRAYESMADSFRDHGHFLISNGRYAAAFEHTDDPDRFAIEIAKAGYATDPAYAEKLIGLMQQHNLYQYDV